MTTDVHAALIEDARQLGVGEELLAAGAVHASDGVLALTECGLGVLAGAVRAEEMRFGALDHLRARMRN